MNRLEVECILPLCLVSLIVYNLFPYGKRFVCFLRIKTVERSIAEIPAISVMEG